MALVWPVRGGPKEVGLVGLTTFHNRTVMSLLPLARVCPSGLNATELTTSVWPVRGGPRGVGWAGPVTFHNRTVWLVLPLARVCPSGLNTTELTRLVWPASEVDKTAFSLVIRAV